MPPRLSRLLSRSHESRPQAVEGGEDGPGEPDAAALRHAGEPRGAAPRLHQELRAAQESELGGAQAPALGGGWHWGGGGGDAGSGVSTKPSWEWDKNSRKLLRAGSLVRAGPREVKDEETLEEIGSVSQNWEIRCRFNQVLGGHRFLGDWPHPTAPCCRPRALVTPKSATCRKSPPPEGLVAGGSSTARGFPLPCAGRRARTR